MHTVAVEFLASPYYFAKKKKYQTSGHKASTSGDVFFVCVLYHINYAGWYSSSIFDYDMRGRKGSVINPPIRLKLSHRKPPTWNAWKYLFFRAFYKTLCILFIAGLLLLIKFFIYQVICAFFLSFVLHIFCSKLCCVCFLISCFFFFPICCSLWIVVFSLGRDNRDDTICVLSCTICCVLLSAGSLTTCLYDLKNQLFANKIIKTCRAK